MEIPNLSEEEKQKLFTEMWLGSMMCPMGFIGTVPIYDSLLYP